MGLPRVCSAKIIPPERDEQATVKTCWVNAPSFAILFSLFSKLSCLYNTSLQLYIYNCIDGTTQEYKDRREQKKIKQNVHCWTSEQEAHLRFIIMQVSLGHDQGKVTIFLFLLQYYKWVFLLKSLLVFLHQVSFPLFSSSYLLHQKKSNSYFNPCILILHIASSLLMYEFFKFFLFFLVLQVTIVSVFLVFLEVTRKHLLFLNIFCQMKILLSLK